MSRELSRRSGARFFFLHNLALFCVLATLASPAMAQAPETPLTGEWQFDFNAGGDSHFGQSVDTGITDEGAEWIVIGNPGKGDGFVNFMRRGLGMFCSNDSTMACSVDSDCGAGFCSNWVGLPENPPVDHPDGSGLGTGQFGYSVAMTDDASLAIVGAPGSNKAYVYRLTDRSIAPWVKESEIESPFPVATNIDARFGWSVDIDTSDRPDAEARAIVGAPGADISLVTDAGGIGMYQRSGGNWNLLLTRTGPPEDFANHGWAVAVSDDSFFVGTPGENDSRGRVQQRFGDVGEFVVTIDSSLALSAGTEFGASLDADDGQLIVGTIGPPNSAVGGYAEIFRQTAAPILDPPTAPEWQFSQRITRADGQTVAIDGNLALVGSPTGNSADLFFRDPAGDPDVWDFVENIRPAAADDPDVGVATDFPDDRHDRFNANCADESCVGDRFGTALALSAQNMIIGAPYAEQGNDSSGQPRSKGFDSGISYTFELAESEMPAGPESIQLTTTGPVLFEIMRSDNDLRSMFFVDTPSTTGTGGCELDRTTSGGGVFIDGRVLENDRSRIGCRQVLTTWQSADARFETVTYTPGRTFRFRLRVLKDGVESCPPGEMRDQLCDVYEDPDNYVEWSSVAANNTDLLPHARITERYSSGIFARDGTMLPVGGRIYQIAWESGDDRSFDDLLIVMRVFDDPGTTDVIELDLDGDGLWDDWEVKGIDWNGNGIIEPRRGEDFFNRVDYDHKELFVEYDFMAFCDPNEFGEAGSLGCDTDTSLFSTVKHEPDPASLSLVRKAFALAPVMNPDGESGIRVVFDKSESMPHKDVIGMDDDPCDVAGLELKFITCRDFSDIKANLFPGPGPDGTRLSAYPRWFTHRYLVFGHSHSPSNIEDLDTALPELGSSGGRGELLGEDINGDAHLGGNDLVVTRGESSAQDATDFAVTIMHEIGHTLGLGHGGSDLAINYKPNYQSVMNYSFSGGKGIPTFRVGGGAPIGKVEVLDFSRQSLPTLNEAALIEGNGVGNSVPAVYDVVILNDEQSVVAIDELGVTYYCEQGVPTTILFDSPVNWNCSDAIDGPAVAANINDGSLKEPSDPNELLSGHDDWSNIQLAFQGLPGAAGSWASRNQFIELPPDVPLKELDLPVADAGSQPDGDPFTPPLLGTIFEPYSCTLGSTITLNGGGSAHPVNEIVGYAWDYPGAGAVDATGVTPNFQCSDLVGDVPIHLTVTDDSGSMAGDEGTVRVGVDAGSDVVGECGSSVTLGNGVFVSSDLAYSWTDASGSVVANTASYSELFPLGADRRTLSVTDSRNISVSDDVNVSIVDTTPPSIDSLTASRDVLWPPNHNMRTINLEIIASDVCDADVQNSCRVVEVTSDEPDSGLDEEDLPGDIVIVDADTVQVRQERWEEGDGRVYTVVVECTDSTGNNATRSSIGISVPHDQMMPGRP